MSGKEKVYPAVSFCMSTYKRPFFLKKQIETILKQSFVDFEIVICDNDPQSGGGDIVRQNGDPRIKYFPNVANLGMIKSFNRTIELASGEFIVMITDDDPVYPDMLETLIDLKNEYPGYGMYLGGCDWFCTHHEVGKLYGIRVGTNTCLSDNHDLNFIAAYKPDQFVGDLFAFRIFQHYLWSTCIVKKEVLIERGGIPDYGTPFLGDYAYMSVMGSHSGCVIINRSLGCQTLHSENFGRKQNEQLITAAINFPAYMEQKLSYLQSWPVIKQQMQHFAGIWMVSHLAFLYRFSNEHDESLTTAKNKIFQIDYMKKLRSKFFLKRRFPILHDQLVALKLKIKSSSDPVRN